MNATDDVLPVPPPEPPPRYWPVGQFRGMSRSNPAPDPAVAAAQADAKRLVKDGEEPVEDPRLQQIHTSYPG